MRPEDDYGMRVIAAKERRIEELEQQLADLRDGIARSYTFLAKGQLVNLEAELKALQGGEK